MKMQVHNLLDQRLNPLPQGTVLLDRLAEIVDEELGDPVDDDDVADRHHYIHDWANYRGVRVASW